jgi:hypothetical protein
MDRNKGFSFPGESRYYRVENLWKSEWLKISEDDRCLESEI